MFGYIYKTRNMINGKLYIGQKKGEYNPKYFGSGKYFRSALNKYGKDNFKLEVIIYAEDKQKLHDLERQYIKEYRDKFGRDNLYNITDGGEGITGIEPWNKNRTKEDDPRILGISLKMQRPMSEEHKKALRGIIRRKRGPQTEDTKEKIRLSKIGDLNPCKRPEIRKKLSESHKGIYPTLESLEKRRQSMLRVWQKKRSTCQN